MPDQTKVQSQNHNTDKVKEKKRSSGLDQKFIEGLAAESMPFEKLLSSSATELPLDRHVALLGNSRLSHRANAIQKARIIIQLQRSYGNQYVQRVLDIVQDRKQIGSLGPVKDALSKDKHRPVTNKIYLLSQPLLLKTMKGIESVYFNYWLFSTYNGRTYGRLRNELENKAKYEFVIYTKTEKGWERKYPPEGTRINQVRWLIKPTKDKKTWFQAYPDDIVDSLIKHVKKLRKEKPKERVPDIKFFSDPELKNKGSKGEWELKTDTKEGMEFYEKNFSDDIETVIPCHFTFESGGELEGTWREKKVKIKSGQMLGKIKIIGRVGVEILVKHSLHGRPMIFGYWPQFFKDDILNKLPTSEVIRKQVEELCEE